MTFDQLDVPTRNELLMQIRDLLVDQHMDANPGIWWLDAIYAVEDQAYDLARERYDAQMELA